MRGALIFICRNTALALQEQANGALAIRGRDRRRQCEHWDHSSAPPDENGRAPGDFSELMTLSARFAPMRETA